MIQVRASIIMPAFQAEAWIEDSIESVLTDLGSQDELIVVNDGSSDNTSALLAKYPVTVVTNHRPLGPGAARNAGVRVSRGRYIGFLDADDLLVPGGLLWRADFLDTHHDLGSVTGLVGEFVGARGETLSPTLDLPPFDRRFLTIDFFRQGGHLACPLTNTLYRRELCEKIGPFHEDLPCGQDIDFFFRGLLISPSLLVPRPTIRYRIHHHNRSVVPDEGGAQESQLSRACAYLNSVTYGIPLRLGHSRPTRRLLRAYAEENARS